MVVFRRVKSENKTPHRRPAGQFKLTIPSKLYLQQPTWLPTRRCGDQNKPLIEYLSVCDSSRVILVIVRGAILQMRKLVGNMKQTTLAESE